MRTPLLLLAGLALAMTLAGCNSITRLDSDSFEVSAAGAGAFAEDDAICRHMAALALDDDLRLQDATSYTRNRAYNGLYGGCMTRRGHASRAYIKNLLPDLGALQAAGPES